MRRYLILTALALLSAALPLLSGIGRNLEYEYALFAGYAALLLLPAAGLLLPKHLLPLRAGVYAPAYAWDVLWICLISPLLVLAPGALLLATKSCLCSGPGFGFWLLVLWYPGWVLANAVMHLVMRLRSHGQGRGRLLLGVVAAYALVTANAAFQLWTMPQKHWLDPLLGFWHGPIYDTYISVDHGLILARAEHLAIGLSLLLLAWLRPRFLHVAPLLATLALAVTAGVFASDYPSTRNSKVVLDQLLPGVLEGDGFSLHYQPLASAQGGAPVEVQRLKREAEFHLKELTAVLQGERGEVLPHVSIYAYPSRDEKKLWFGGGATDVTDVHTPSVHVTAETWPHPTLRHELVHALASGFGYRGIGFHPNMAFTEGLAVALAPHEGALTLDEASADLLQNHRLPALDQLFSPTFWTVAGERAYTVAGSLLRYLIAKHGVAGVKALYSGQTWEEAFGQSREQIVAAWQTQVSTGYDGTANKLYTDQLFSDPGLLHDRCPHSKADLAASRSANAYTRMRQLVGWDPDTDYLPYLLRLDPSARDVQAQILRRQVSALATERVPQVEAIAAMRAKLAATRQHPAKSLADIWLGLSESDLLKQSGDTIGSLHVLGELKDDSKVHFLGAQLSRELEARLALERDDPALPPAQAAEWRRYLAGWRHGLPSPTIQVHGAGEPWLLTYFKLRAEKETPLGTGELRRLLTETKVDPTLSPSFHQEWFRMIAERLMRLDAYREAELAYQQAAAVSPPATREVFEQYSRRARFYAGGGLAAAGQPGSKQ